MGRKCAEHPEEVLKRHIVFLLKFIHPQGFLEVNFPLKRTPVALTISVDTIAGLLRGGLLLMARHHARPPRKN